MANTQQPNYISGCGCFIVMFLLLSILFGIGFAIGQSLV